MSTRTLAAFVSLGVVLGGCTASPAPPPSGPVVLGVLTDTTGAGEDAGTEAVRGAELAVEVVNEPNPELRLPLAPGAGLPGLRGAQLRLAIGDSGGDPDAAEAVTDELIVQPVVGIVAADQTDVVANAAAYATRRGVPMVDAATSAEHLLDLGLDWYFRVTPTDRMLAEAAFALLAVDPPPGGGRAVVLTTAEDAGSGVVELVPELARAAGLTVADTIQVSDAPDDDTALQLAETAPDVMVAIADTASGARLLREVLDGLAAPPAVVELGPGHLEQDAGLQGSVRPVAWSDEFALRHPLAAAVAGLYEARYEQPMTGRAAAAFTATLALARALDAAEDDDPAAVRVALRQMSLPATQLVMPWQGLRFAPNGQNELATVVVEQHHEQGWQVVFPPELAAGPVEWPTPPPVEETTL